ncbi:hypothetical protein U8335_20385 [Roseiconus lacunae]|uniref:hypothetical protein n=1 Tax=Roseiconus lacunae TaxID=2605694 RepID=UPI0030858206|nr:hypothetical protein U8335_20385 [Stieleria sp. HD01]
MKCNTALRSPLKDAGSSDTCPTCGDSFTVPGESELRDLIKEREAIALAKEQAKQQELARLEMKAKRAEAEKSQQQEAELAARIAKLERDEMEQAAADQLELELREAISSVTTSPDSHDWTTGAPWVYDCVEMGTVSENWKATLQQLLNSRAAKGWEYYRSETLMREVPAGCIGALFGASDTQVSVVVLVFRRPTSVVRAEQKVLSKTNR